MQRIPVLKDFDKTQPVGYLILIDEAVLLPDHELEMAYSILAGTPEHPTKTHVHELGLIYNPTPAKAVGN